MLRLRGSRHHALPVHNIPARYCTDYLGDIGVAVDPNPMDFTAWAEVFLDGRWYIIDARATTISASGVLSWTVVVTPRTSRYRPLWDRQACALEVITQVQTKPKTADEARIAK
jgi:hypothetical protein